MYTRTFQEGMYMYVAHDVCTLVCIKCIFNHYWNPQEGREGQFFPMYKWGNCHVTAKKKIYLEKRYIHFLVVCFNIYM